MARICYGFNASLPYFPSHLSCGHYLVTTHNHFAAFSSFLYFVHFVFSLPSSFLLTTATLPPPFLRLFLLLHIALDFGCGSAMFGTFNLLVSDVIDDDMKLNDRQAPLSSSVFGTNALITKPAISLTPMLVIYLLNPFGFQEFKRDPEAFIATATAFSTDAAASMDRLMSLQSACLTLIWAWPMVIGLMQIFVFSHYSLRHTHQDRVAKHKET